MITKYIYSTPQPCISRMLVAAGLALLSLAGVVSLQLPEVEVTLPVLGPVTGLEKRTKTYQSAPYSNRPMYSFRAIPYAHPVTRFQQSRLWNDSPLTGDGSQYDGTRDGPVCPQGNISSQLLDTLLQSSLRQVALSVLPPHLGLLADILVSLLLQVLEILLELDPGFLAPDRLLGDLLHDWLDVTVSLSEDCLHLAVYTPWRPEGSSNKALPVMFFIHGGAFAYGTQVRMAGDRLQAWGDVVVVSINYRLGPLGFLCLETDEAGGNMGLLDMVVALEWTHQFIEYFGGDPNQITIFGESAGGAAIGHLLLSKEGRGLFARGIGQSGSPIASWAFDSQAGKEGVEVARLAGCREEELASDDLIVNCLRAVPAENVSAAFYQHSLNQRRQGEGGFGGTTPCGQTHGQRKFYRQDETPMDLLYDGDFEHLPIMFGANSHEGSYVFGDVYNDFLVPNNLADNQTFLRYDIIHSLMKVVGVSNSYAVENLIEEDYFQDWMMGNLTLMQPGLVDLLSVFFIKASSYEFLAQTSKYQDSYWYAFDYLSQQKSLFNLFFLNPDSRAGIEDPGVSHADELLYLFDLELPVVLCNTEAMLEDVMECLPPLEDCLLTPVQCVQSAVSCVTEAEGPVREKWHDCLTGQLSQEEQLVSSHLTQLWTNFATSGSPGLGSSPWDRDYPVYTQVTTHTLQEDSLVIPLSLDHQRAQPTA